MRVLAELQAWYLAQCDGEWEHHRGVSIGTLDNPGWWLKVDLTGTDLSGRPFPRQSYGVGEGGPRTKGTATSLDNWLDCKVEKDQFVAAGGPEKLEELIAVFLKWAKEAV